MSENENQQPIAEPSKEGSATPESAEAKPSNGATPSAEAKPEAEAAPAAEAKPAADAPAPEKAEAPEDTPKADDAKTDAAQADAKAPEGEAKADDGSKGDAEGSDGKKKRKRRRKKKKKEGGSDKKDQAFARFFEGSGPRQHAFRVGEVVAGRVTRVEDGAIMVDLFGKAIAIADVLEPREVEESTAPEATESTAVGVAAPTDAAKSEATAEAAPAAEAAKPEAAAEAPAADAPAEAKPEAAADAPAADAPAEAAAEAPAAEAPADAKPEGAEAPAADAPAEAAAEAPAADAPAAEAKPEEPAVEPIPLEPEPPHPEPPQVGAIFRGRVGSVSESGHIAIVNRNIERPRAKAAIKLAHDEKRRVPGVVFGYNRGGFDVLIAGIRCFAPARGMSLGMIVDPETLVGRKLEFSVPKSKGKSIVVTRRSILEKEARKAAKDRLDELKVGEKITGKVTDVRDYGALVDIGGIDGLVHMSEIAWTRGGKPSDHVKVGDEVQVEVLKVQKMSRKDRYGKVSLSIRTCLPDPWKEHEELLSPGKPRKGKVVSLTEFGAFLELAPGIEGLLHISELDGKPAHAKDVLTEGEELDVVIDRKDEKQRRLSLSLLTAADLEAIEKGELDLTVAPRSTKKGALVTVIVDRIERHGLLVQVKGLIGKRGRGYVPMRELPEEGETKKKFSQGSEHEMKVIGTDRDGRLRLSVKGKLRDEERKAVQQYRKEAASKGFGTFGDLLKSKLEK